MVLLRTPCLRRFFDAPLALLIGNPAKRVKEIGAPSLKHPFARVFTALVAPSPLANPKGCNAEPSLTEQWTLGAVHAVIRNWLGQPTGPTLSSRGQRAKGENLVVQSLWHGRATAPP